MSETPRSAWGIADTRTRHHPPKTDCTTIVVPRPPTGEKSVDAGFNYYGRILPPEPECVHLLSTVSMCATDVGTGTNATEHFCLHCKTKIQNSTRATIPEHTDVYLCDEFIGSAIQVCPLDNTRNSSLKQPTPTSRHFRYRMLPRSHPDPARLRPPR